MEPEAVSGGFVMKGLRTITLIFHVFIEVSKLLSQHRISDQVTLI